MFWILTTLLAVIPSALPCGEEVVLAKGEKYALKSPNYPSPLSGTFSCKWKITTESTGGFNLVCPSIDITPSESCLFSDIAIYADHLNLAFCSISAIDVSIDTKSFEFRFFTMKNSDTNDIQNGFSCTVSLKEDLPDTCGTEAPEPPIPEPVPQPSPNSCACVIKNTTRVVGGQLAELHEYPWQAVLKWNNGGAFCGGTVISADFVLTAAHCLTNSTVNQFYVSVGEYKLFTTTDTSQTIHTRTSEIILHENYDNVTNDNDIGLLRLATAIEFNNAISPACLPYGLDDDSISGQTGIVTGWGTTIENGRGSSTLREVEMPLLTSSECRKYFPWHITDNMICTYEVGKDSCQGDSGGPLIWNRNGTHFLVGVTSWGAGCGRFNKPGAYTKVTNYLNWIELQTTENFCHA